MGGRGGVEVREGGEEGGGGGALGDASTRGGGGGGGVEREDAAASADGVFPAAELRQVCLVAALKTSRW